MPDESVLTDPPATVVEQPNRVSNEAPSKLVVYNEVPSKLVVCGEGNRRFVLAPLEGRLIDDEDWQSFGAGFRALVERRVVALDTYTAQPAVDRGLILFGLSIWVVPAYLISGIFFGGFWYWLSGLVAAVLIGIAWWRGRKGTPSLEKVVLPLLLVLAVGIAAPVASVYFGGGVNTAVDVWRTDGGDNLVYLTLIGRMLQAVLIAIAALLPALLYFLFDRMKVETLRGNFVRDIFRFDPTVETASDVQARDGALMDELYGPDESRTRPSASEHTTGPGGRSQPGRRAPVWIATVVITIGWILCLLNPDVKAPLKDAANIVLLFEPQPSPVVFAFLGAYIFALQYLLRSYLRADLRPKSYTHVTVRIFVAVIFAWVLEQLYLNVPSANPKQDSLLVAAFVVGVLPETLLVRLQEAARRIAGGRNRTRLPMLYERYPLTELEGIDIYDRTRLLDEGVGNIEGLAHHNLPELMMQTRIPVARLVYWTDQAILYLHTATTVEGTGKGTNATSSDQVRSEANSGTARLRILQEHGIHTATDLKNAYEGAKKRTCEKEKTGEQHAGDGELNAFLALLGSEEPVNGARVYRLQAILDAIEDEEWMQNLEHWHAHGCHSSKTLILRNGDLSEGVDPALPDRPQSTSTSPRPPRQR